VIDRIAELMRHETAGDPITGLKWTHKTTEKIAAELKNIGIEVSPRTVARLLRQMGFSLRVNHKMLSRVCAISPQERNAQFEHIAELRAYVAQKRLPVISVDSKKKELIGQFKNSGASWEKKPVPVKDHDFPSEAAGKVVPYGIYDIQCNHGFVVLGTSRETADFAVDAIEMWWREEGRHRYQEASELVILADCGGGNGPTNRAWKLALHQRLAKHHGLSVTVAHYPPGTSKWNPIEHRLFSQISKNWAGRPLDSNETALNYIQTTTTKSGLTVSARLLDRHYEKGKTISPDLINSLPITRHPLLPKWNYTISPPAT
jgi:hypothetical protein